MPGRGSVRLPLPRRPARTARRRERGGSLPVSRPHVGLRHLPPRRGHPLPDLPEAGGALLELDGVRGVHFAVWAPNAERVSVVGDFNRWDGRHHPMASAGLPACGSCSCPAWAGDLYKYEIKGRHDFLADQVRPLRLRRRAAAATPPRWSGTTRAYAWSDGAWMARRRETSWSEPADQRLRGASRLLAARARRTTTGGSTYRELADGAGPVREGDGLHPHRAAAGDRAPLRRLLGLPDHGLLRPDLPLRHAGRLQVLRRPLPPGGDRGDPRLGARALSPGTPTAWPTSTAPISTSTPTRG